MSSAIPRMGRWAASVVVLTLGCTTATRIDYQHEPTARIESDHVLTRPELAPFTVDGVVAAPLLRVLTTPGTQLWLTMWARGKKTVTVRAVSLVGTGAQSGQRQQFPGEKTVTTDKKETKEVQSGDILVGVLPNDALTSMAASGSVKLTVELRVQPATDYQTLSFDITRRETKQWVTH